MPRYFSVTVLGNPHVFKTDLTDEQALEALRRRPDRSDFASSLLENKKLTAGQLAWVHKLALEPLPRPSGRGRPPRPEASPAPAPGPPGPPLDIDMSRVVNMFENASKRLKRPRVTFERFRLERDASGDIACEGAQGPLGKICKDGLFYPVSDIPGAIADDLERLSDDPVGFACEYGKASGRCCFCSLPLKEPRSLGVGYGKVCAGNYAMPWGNNRATTPDILGP